MKTNFNDNRSSFLLLTPSFIIIICIAIFPLMTVFINSFTDSTFASGKEAQSVGIKNYQKLLSVRFFERPPLLDEGGMIQKDEQGNILYQPAQKVLPRKPLRYREVRSFSFFGKRYIYASQDDKFIHALEDTLLFMIIAVSLETILGMLIALTLNSYFIGRNIMRVAMLIPWAIPTAISSRIWEWMFASSRVGFFNTIFNSLGLSDGQFPFLIEPASQLIVIILIDVWKTTPFMALLLLAGLQVIPKSLYESASLDGASNIRRFFSITLPLLMPTLLIALIFRMMDSLRVFDLFQIIFGGKRFSLASFAYFELISNKATGYSSAISVLIFLIIVVFATIYMFVNYLSRDAYE